MKIDRTAPGSQGNDRRIVFIRVAVATLSVEEFNVNPGRIGTYLEQRSRSFQYHGLIANVSDLVCKVANRSLVIVPLLEEHVV